MSSKNDDSSVGIAIVVGGFAIMAMFLFALAAFVALALTIVCIIAWRKPLIILNETITPREAHLFVYSALGGMVVLPIFFVFCSVLFQYSVADNYWGYIYLAGYVLGGCAAVAYLAHEEEEKAKTAVSVLAPPPQPPVIEQTPPPYYFASWDDEEELK